MMPSKISCLFSVVLIALIAGCTAGSNSRHFVDDRHPGATLRIPIKHRQMETFSKSVRLINGELAAKYDLARHFQRMGSHVIAIEALNEILSINPRYVEVHNALGYSLDCIGDYFNARQHYKAAIALNPDLDYAYNNLGYSYLLAGDFRSAVVALEKAISLNDSNQKYLKNLGYAYFKEGNPAMAENAFDRLDDRNVAERIRKQLGLVSPRSNVAHGSRMQASPTAAGYTDNRAIDPMDDLIADDEVDPENGRSAVIEVSNGNGVRRMARSVGDFLKRNGMRVTRLTNADHFGHARTVIYYRKGYYDEAWRIQRLLPGLTQQGHLVAARLGCEPIRVLIGQDLVTFHASMARDVDVEITNGNGIDGMAGRLGRHLRREGFRVGRLTNADHFAYQKTILFYGRGKADQAMLVADVLPGGGRIRMVELDQSRVRVQILMGADMVF